MTDKEKIQGVELRLGKRTYRRGWTIYEGKQIPLIDFKTGRRFLGTVRIKAVRCGKKNCTKCPHKSYAYAQFRIGKKVTEKYLGVVN